MKWIARLTQVLQGHQETLQQQDETTCEKPLGRDRTPAAVAWRIERARELLAAGADDKSIADAIGITHRTIHRFLVDHELRPRVSHSPALRREEKIRTMAANGSSVPQMAEAIGMSEGGLRKLIRRAGIDVPADRCLRRSPRHNASRILEQTIQQAELLTADVKLIAWHELDPARFPEWSSRLIASRKALDSFVRQLDHAWRRYGINHETAAATDIEGLRSPAGKDAPADRTRGAA